MKTENKNEKGTAGESSKKTQKEEKRTEMTIDQVKAEMESLFRQINRCKAEIEKQTDVIIKELSKLREHRKKIETQEQIDVKKRPGMKKEAVDLDYELANMKMIKKLLDLSGQLADKHEEFDSKKLKKRTLSLRKRVKSLRIETEGKNGRQKILIVDDDATTVNIISYVLAQHNYQVISSLNAEDGLKTTLKEMPALILLDIMLPGMDGFQLLSILKDNEETSHIPVVLLSSLAGEKDILKGLEIGAEDYILKPFSPRVLHFKLKKLIGVKNEHVAPHHRV